MQAKNTPLPEYIGNIGSQMSFTHSEPMASQIDGESEVGATVLQTQSSQTSSATNLQSTPFVTLNTSQVGGQQISFSRKPADDSGPSTSGGPKH